MEFNRKLDVVNIRGPSVGMIIIQCISGGGTRMQWHMHTHMYIALACMQ